MRRTATGLVVLLLRLAVPGVAAASQPVTTSFDTSGSFIDDDLSAACGFDVTVTRAGLTRVTLFFNRAGLVVRETDSTVGTTITYSAAATGKSFTYPRVLVITFDYGAGAVLGSAATARVVGSQENLPGTPRSPARWFSPARLSASLTASPWWRSTTRWSITGAVRARTPTSTPSARLSPEPPGPFVHTDMGAARRVTAAPRTGVATATYAVECYWPDMSEALAEDALRRIASASAAGAAPTPYCRWAAS